MRKIAFLIGALWGGWVLAETEAPLVVKYENMERIESVSLYPGGARNRKRLVRKFAKQRERCWGGVCSR
ncbi:MAG: hypothetical protein RMJ49_03560 [Bacteroidia bacterium]|nr:hypothetical protein [Bacteroidia bacterium]